MKGRTNAGGSSVQIPLDAPTALTALAGNAKVSLTWTDPKDKYATPEGEQAQDPQQLVSKWAYTKIVRKVGSAPTGPNDGVTVVSSEVRNAYQTNPFVDTGVENDITYFYGAFAYNEDGVPSDGAFTTANPVAVFVYGVEWNGTGTTKWTRIDDAKDFLDPVPAVANGEGSSPFDDRMPWSGMTVSEDPNVGTVVAIPKFWYKATQLSSGLRVEISNSPKEGFYVSPAHIDRGDGFGERDVIYVGRYHSGDDGKSVTGRSPTKMSRTEFRNKITSLGNDVWQWDFLTIYTIKLLYLVEFANWDSQSVIGYGCFQDETELVDGHTDSMGYHTGTTAQFRDQYGFCQYRNIEGLWDICATHIDGVYIGTAAIGGDDMRIIKNPANFQSTESRNIGQSISHTYYNYSSGYFDRFIVNDLQGVFWINPTTLRPQGSTTTYCPDYIAYNRGFVVSATQADEQSLMTGIFNLTCGVSFDYEHAASRLMVLPNPVVTV